jgi:hypothetical protein
VMKSEDVILLLGFWELRTTGDVKCRPTVYHL